MACVNSTQLYTLYAHACTSLVQQDNSYPGMQATCIVFLISGYLAIREELLVITGKQCMGSQIFWQFNFHDR